MSTVNGKIKWQKDSPTLTLRVSGQWADVIKALHTVAENIKEQAIMRGHVKMNRPRAACQVHEAQPDTDS